MGVTVDNGTLTDYNAATSTRTVGGVASQEVQRNTEIGTASIANNVATPGTTAGNIVAARDTRRRVMLYNDGTVTVYVGAATVTVAAGFPLDPGSALDIYTVAAVQGITSSGTGSVRYLEEYD